jgi:hypothetical protein
LSSKRATGLRKIGEVSCKDLLQAQASKFTITVPDTQKKRSAVQMGSSDDDVTRDEEEEATA